LLHYPVTVKQKNYPTYRKENIIMQKQQTHYNGIVPALLAILVVACLGLAPATQAAGRPSIVGMWSVHYVSTTGGPEVFTFDQFHSDGL